MKSLLFTLTLVVFTSFSLMASFAPSEKQKEMLDLALNGEGSFYSLHEFVSDIPNHEGHPLVIRYLRFGDSPGLKGAIAISPGFTEAALKYTEMAYDLQKMGYSPIYVMNHRGQGQSDRVLEGDDNETRHKGYVDDFFDFVDDYNKFVSLIIKDTDTNSNLLINPDRFFLIAHSMGGAVAANYLIRHTNPFSRVILSSPMLKVKLRPVPVVGDYISDGVNTWLSKKMTGTSLVFGFQDWLNGGVWRIEEKEFSTGRGFDGPATNLLTGDPSRYWFHINLLNQHPGNIAIGGATYGWGHEALDGTVNGIQSANMYNFTYNNHNNSETKKPKDLQIKIFQAGQDSIVDNIGQNWFCNKVVGHQAYVLANLGQRNIEERASQACELISEPFLEAEHEIFIERDSIRDQAFKIIADFFSTH